MNIVVNTMRYYYNFRVPGSYSSASRYLVNQRGTHRYCNWSEFYLKVSIKLTFNMKIKDFAY